MPSTQQARLREFAGKIVGDLDQMVAVADDRGDRIVARECLDLALLQCDAEQISGVDAPVDILERIDALLSGQDRYEIPDPGSPY